MYHDIVLTDDWQVRDMKLYHRDLEAMTQTTGGDNRGLPTTPRPKKGKGSALLIRVTQTTRDALEAEANRRGESLSATAERWLDDSRLGQATYEQRVGGVSNAVEVLALAAREVAKIERDDWSPEAAREALLSAWRYLIPRALPGTVPSELRQRLIEAQRCLSGVAATLNTALCNLPPEHPVKAADDVRPNRFIPGLIPNIEAPSAIAQQVAAGAPLTPEMTERFQWGLERLGSAFASYIDEQVRDADPEPFDLELNDALAGVWQALTDFYKAHTELSKGVAVARAAGEQIARGLLPDHSEMDI